MNFEEQKPLIMAIDDSSYYLRDLEHEFNGKNVEFIGFQGPTAFEMEAKTDDINRAKLIIVDYDFKSCTAEDRDIPTYIREMYPDFIGKIVLLTLLDDFLRGNKAIEEKFDAILSKRRDLTWEKIQAFVK